MKSTLKTMLAIVAGAAAITACQKENIVEGGDAPQTASVLNPMTFTAYMEGEEPVSKTSIDASHYDTDHLYDVKWVAGDKISVFDGATENNGNQEFTLDTGAGTTSGTFIGTAAEADTYYAIYPYAPTKKLTSDDIMAAVSGIIVRDLEEWKEMWFFMPEYVYGRFSDKNISPEDQALIIAYLEEKTIGAQHDGDSFSNIIIPAEQTVSEGQFVDPKAMLMIAKSDDASALSFKNICAYIRVTPQFDCYAISIKSNGSLNIAGTVTVNYNDGNPTATITANGADEVLFAGTIKAGNSYYIAVLPATLSSGFSIQFLAADDSHHLYTRSTSNSMTLTRNNVTNLGSFETTGYWTGNIVTIGNDGNPEHNWQMVTPTLKLATTSARLSHDSNKHSDNNWGNDWVLPTEADLTPLLGRFNCPGTLGNTATIRGTGIFNFAPPMEISGTTGSNLSGLWCNEDTKYIRIDEEHYNGGALLIDNRGFEEVPIFYKYTK